MLVQCYPHVMMNMFRYVIQMLFMSSRCYSYVIYMLFICYIYDIDNCFINCICKCLHCQSLSWLVRGRGSVRVGRASRHVAGQPAVPILFCLCTYIYIYMVKADQWWSFLGTPALKAIIPLAGVLHPP